MTKKPKDQKRLHKHRKERWKTPLKEQGKKQKHQRLLKDKFENIKNIL